MKALIAVCMAAVIAGCASAPRPSVDNASTLVVTTAAAGAAGSATKVCTREITTGSNLPTSRCRTQRELERERQLTQALLRDMKRPQTLPTGSAPGVIP